MNRSVAALGVMVPFVILAGCTNDSGKSGTGGMTGAGGTPGVTDAGTGGLRDGGPIDSPADAPGDASGSGGVSGTGGTSMDGGTGGSTVTLAQLCPAPAPTDGGAADAGTSDAGAAEPLAFVNQTYLGDPRVAPSEAIFSFINTIDDPTTQTLRLHNGGATSVQISALHIVGNPSAPASNPPTLPGAAGGTLFPPTYNQVSLPEAFKMTASVAIPATLAAGANLDVTVQYLSTKTNPVDRMLNIGGQSASAVLVAQTTAGCVPAGLYGVTFWNNTETPPDATTGLPSNNWARYEPTFGQVVATLGYKVNLGSTFIQLLNTNDMSIPNPGASTEEVQVHTFVKFDPAAPVELLSVGRFSPPTDDPYGWYAVGSLNGTPVGSDAGGAPVITDAQPAAVATGSTQAATQPAPLRVVATMAAFPLGVDWNTSNHSEQVLPPFRGTSSATTFDPGTTVFGVWAFTNQRSVGGLTSAGVAAPNVANGDYVYSEDTLNIDSAHTHRLRVYPLKNRAGVLVPHAYLLGWEEATNGDYQDYVFLLKNVSPGH